MYYVLCKLLNHASGKRGYSISWLENLANKNRQRNHPTKSSPAHAANGGHRGRSLVLKLWAYFLNNFKSKERPHSFPLCC